MEHFLVKKIEKESKHQNAYVKMRPFDQQLQWIEDDVIFLLYFILHSINTIQMVALASDAFWANIKFIAALYNLKGVYSVLRLATGPLKHWLTIGITIRINRNLVHLHRSKVCNLFYILQNFIGCHFFYRNIYCAKGQRSCSLYVTK
jgi:hypothetical protein